MKKPFAVTALIAIAIILLGVLLLVFLNNFQPANSVAQRYTFTVVNVYPHDSNAFTEGLVFADGFLYESTGLYGSSTLRRVDLLSGTVLQEVALSSEFFGEGIAIVENNVVQLTWQSQVGFVYDKNSFALLRNFSYPTEGWGLTFDGKQLIMSDGSDKLYFLDAETFVRIGQVQVHDGNASVPELNELEYINGDVYANVFGQQKIAVINPETGQVKGWIDLEGLQATNASNAEDVLNGIAYDAKSNRLFVTGKDWPQLYEVRLVPQK